MECLVVPDKWYGMVHGTRQVVLSGTWYQESVVEQ